MPDSSYRVLPWTQADVAETQRARDAQAKASTLAAWSRPARGQAKGNANNESFVVTASRPAPKIRIGPGDI